MLNRIINTGYTDIVLCLLSAVILVALPEIDLAVAGAFYDQQSEEFFLKQNPFFQAVYWLFAVVHLPILLLLIIAGVLVKTGKWQPRNYRKWTITFLLSALIIGPGLLVNTVLKDNSIGRARPAKVVEFGGEHNFTPAFVYSGECSKNCSFVSGHAAMGFYFIILGWLFASRKLFWAGFAVGVVLSLTRIVMGGHFFSDTLFAFWVVYFTTAVLGRLTGFANPLDKTEP